MVNNQDFLYYKTPDHEFQVNYPDADRPFEHKVTTQLSKNVVIIRVIATIVFSVLLMATKPVWIWPVAIAGLAFAGWTMYSHLIKKDPLVEVFHEIVGSEEAFNKLPEIHLDAEKRVADNLDDIDWNDLKDPLSRAITEDGRRILIVKCLTRHPEQDIFSNSQVKTVMSFVEKLGSGDLPPKISNLSPENSVRFTTVLQAFGTLENDLSARHSFGSTGSGNNANYVYSWITPEIANEFLAQQ